MIGVPTIKSSTLYQELACCMNNLEASQSASLSLEKNVGVMI